MEDLAGFRKSLLKPLAIVIGLTVCVDLGIGFSYVCWRACHAGPRVQYVSVWIMFANMIILIGWLTFVQRRRTSWKAENS